MIEGGKPEFYCEAEDSRKVTVEYAARPDGNGTDGILRGMRLASEVGQ